MSQLVRFVDRPGGTVLLDVSPASGGLQLGEGGLDCPPPPVRRTVSDNPAVDGGTISAAPYGLRTVKMPLAYSPGYIDPAQVGGFRANMVRNPELTTNTTDWGSGIGAGGVAWAPIARITTGGPVVEGRTLNFMRLTVASVTTGAVASTGVVLGLGSTDAIGATGGAPFAFQILTRCSRPDRTAQLVVTFHDSAGTQLGIQTTTSVPIGGTDWDLLTMLTTAPAGATRAFARVYSTGGGLWQVGDTMDATAALAETATEIKGYFSGSSTPTPITAPSWFGTPGASTSFLTYLSPQESRRLQVSTLMRLLGAERAWLEVRPDGVTESRYLWLHRPDTETLTRLEGLGGRWAEATAVFLADPFALGPKESLGTLSTTVAGDLQTTISGAGVKGDVPAPMIVTTTSAGGGGGGAGPKPLTLMLASKVGGTAHQCLRDLSGFSVGALPGASTNTTVADATAVGGSLRRWANVAAGQEWVAATGALFSTPGGGNDAKLAGSYRVFLIARGGVTDTDGNTWQAELRLTTPAGWTFLPNETKIGRLASWVTASANPPDTVVDLGVVEFPFGGRPLAPSFDPAVPLAPASLNLYLRHPSGTTDDVDADALLWFPADDTFMAMQYADGGTARTFTADPYTGRVVVQQGGVAVSDAARVQYQGAPPNVVPGVDVTLCAALVSGGLGKGNAALATTLPATFTAAYWPRYLTVA